MRNKTTSESGSYWLQWAFMALLLLLVIGCTEERANLQLTGTVKGLKQGVIYLERWENDSITIMDSTEILGEPNFRMDVYIEEPEVLYLKLTDEGIDEPNIVFFAEPGEMDIQTSLKRFTYDAKISGSDDKKHWTHLIFWSNDLTTVTWI